MEVGHIFFSSPDRTFQEACPLLLANTSSFTHTGPAKSPLASQPSRVTIHKHVFFIHFIPHAAHFTTPHVLGRRCSLLNRSQGGVLTDTGVFTSAVIITSHLKEIFHQTRFVSARLPPIFICSERTLQLKQPQHVF